MDEQKNYYSRILGLSKVFDGVIEEIKNSHLDNLEKSNSSWLFWLLGGPIRDFKRLGEVNKGFQSLIDSGILLSFFPLISMGAAPFIVRVDQLDIVEKALIGFIIGYIMTLTLYMGKIVQFKSGHFHIGAYKTFHRQEYDLFKVALLDNKGDFFFKGIYDYLGTMATNRMEFEQIYSMIDGKLERHIRIEKHQLETKVSLLWDRLGRNEKKTDETAAAYDEFINQLMDEREELLQGYDYVVDLIKDVNTLLFRMKNGLFSTKDLNLLSGFTLFELQDKDLMKIEDVGTTGSTPNTLPLDSKRNWGAIDVIKSKKDNPVINTPYKNHTVVSYKMKIGIGTGKVWVYNFHFDSDNKKAKHLLVNNDIIVSREIYRLIHALCLLSQENYSKRKEAE